MGQGFIIMQIGDCELDQMCEEAIVPALEACGLNPKRVDKHNKGGLLKSEIIRFIEESEIIVADLTNERPNCYLEVGYAMGVDKFSNLLLTARNDHIPDRPNRNPGDPKVHFDLGGYDILYWDPSRLGDFRVELQKRIERRQAILAPPQRGPVSPWDEEWLERHRAVAMTGLGKVERTGHMEVSFALANSKPNLTPRDLAAAAERAQIRTFGWPIGVFFGDVKEYRPRPTRDGIVAEVSVEDRSSYDYWTLRRNGDFFLLKSLFEDERRPGSLFFDTRIVRITETLLYCARLYSRLEVPGTAEVGIRLRHGGLKGRILRSAGHRWMWGDQSTTEDEIADEIRMPLAEIESGLVDLVKRIAEPLFMVFDFFELDDKIYGEIVDEFVKKTR